MSFLIELGSEVKDIVSGFKGTVTGRAEWISGCRQYVVQPPAKDGKLPESVWMDEQRLEVLKQPKNIEKRSTGGPQNIPARRG